MEGSVIIFIFIGAVVIWALFFRQINPSNKTDSQLMWMYDTAMKSYRPSERNENLELIQAEMDKRGLTGNNLKKTSDTQLSENQQEKLDEANKEFKESGMQEEMQKIFESGIPEQMFNKVIEISKIKDISEHEASTYFNELFENASLKYKNSGLSQNEADEKGMKEALSTEVKKA